MREKKLFITVSFLKYTLYKYNKEVQNLEKFEPYA